MNRRRFTSLLRAPKLDVEEALRKYGHDTHHGR